MADNKEFFTLADADTFIFHKKWLNEGIEKLEPEM